jgi:transposase InsO family protein
LSGSRCTLTDHQGDAFAFFKTIHLLEGPYERHLSAILDDFSRYIIAWNLWTTMKAEDVTDTLERALTVSGCDQARIEPRCSATAGPSYVSGELAEWLNQQSVGHPGLPEIA